MTILKDLNDAQKAELKAAIDPLQAGRKLLARIRRAAATAAISNPHINVVMASPPTVTDSKEVPPSATPTPFICNGSNQGVWHVVGGKYGIGGRISAGVQDAVPTELNTYARFEAVADSRYFAARLGPTTAPYRLIVNDQYISIAGTVLTTTTGSTDQYLLFDFGTRAVRKIVLEASRTGKFAGGYVEAGAMLYPVDTSGIPHAVFLADSYAFGSGPDVTSDGVAVQLGDRLGMAIQASGSGGTGWNHPNQSVFTFSTRIANGDLGVSYYPPEAIFLLTSINDAYGSQNYATMQANALAGLQAARAQYPGVPIVVFGCVAAPGKLASDITNAEAAAKAAVAALNDPLCRFAPIDSDPAGRWISGAGSELKFTAPVDAATSATLATAWTQSTSASAYTILFSDGSTKLGSFTKNSTAVTWSGAVTASAVAMVRQTEGNARFVMNQDWAHPSNYGAAYLGDRYARAALGAFEAMLA